LAYGWHHCPFSCHLYDRRDKYFIPELFNAKKLQNEEYLGFFQIGWPNTIKDMDDIINGFKKILSNKDYLSRIDLSKTTLFVPGR
jgi:hypothetical protein